MRFLLLFLLMFLFSFAEMGGHYETAGHGVVPLAIMCVAGTVCKILPICTIAAFLTPRYLPQRRYVLLGSVAFLIILACILLQHAAETAVYHCFDMPLHESQLAKSYGYWLDTFVQVVQWFLVLMGLSVKYLFDNMTTETQRKQRAKASWLRMESELMKEQVAPAMLCKTLHCSGVLARSDPQKASDRLMLLCRLLRYQLYDCRRQNVLLDSEVKFLQDYLTLLKLNGECDDYSLSVKGRTLGVFVPPLLFVSLVQHPAGGELSVGFDMSGDVLSFSVKGSCSRTEEHKVRQRLEQLYPQGFRLAVSSSDTELIVKIG